MNGKLNARALVCVKSKQVGFVKLAKAVSAMYKYPKNSNRVSRDVYLRFIY